MPPACLPCSRPYPPRRGRASCDSAGAAPWLGSEAPGLIRLERGRWTRRRPRGRRSRGATGAGSESSGEADEPDRSAGALPEAESAAVPATLDPLRFGAVVGAKVLPPAAEPG